MIEKIQKNNVNNTGIKRLDGKAQAKNTPTQNSQPNFNGLGGMLLGAVQACEQSPMLNVTVLDLSTAILPRTYYESKTNAFAGLEAFRRESSGLIVNCLIPSFIVLGAAKLLQRPIMGADSSMRKCWANEETIKAIAKHWEAAEGEGEVKVANTYRSMYKSMYGVDGGKEVAFDKALEATVSEKSSLTILDKSVAKMTKATVNETKKSNKHFKKVFELIAKHTNVTEEITMKHGKEAFNVSLTAMTKEAPKVIREFLKHGINDKASIEAFVKKSSNLVKYKSLLGLGAIIPLAISMQPINRWITSKTSGKKGAPIYKDFADRKQEEPTKQEKRALLSQKFVSVGAMVGVALLSMLKNKKAGNTIMQEAKEMGKRVTQFNNIFPTMDQARLISTATFASRMMASEDKNDLREATVRDIATFSAFYFLGDYVSKAIATLIQKNSKKGVTLINDLNPVAKDANIFKKLKHWTFNTSLKSSHEVVGEAAKNLRSICQLGNIAFSLAALGVLIPMITRKKTDQAEAEKLKKAGVPQEEINKYFGKQIGFMMNAHNTTPDKSAFKTFFTAQSK